MGIAVDHIHHDVPDRLIVRIHGDPAPTGALVGRELIKRERIVIRNGRVGRQTKLLTRKELDLLEPGCIRRRCGSDPSRAHTSGKQAWIPSWCKPRRSPSP